ncbi:hypothetical protein TNCV_1116311 [Trichonephila clavipes]|nr:hypothetical protein TNCV_1116311 [Trichonephila clavipes]
MRTVFDHVFLKNDRDTQIHPSGGTAILIKSSQASPPSNTFSRGGRVYDSSSHHSGRKPTSRSFYLHSAHHVTLRVHSRSGGNFRPRAILHFMRRL